MSGPLLVSWAGFSEVPVWRAALPGPQLLGDDPEQVTAHESSGCDGEPASASVAGHGLGVSMQHRLDSSAALRAGPADSRLRSRVADRSQTVLDALCPLENGIVRGRHHKPAFVEVGRT